MNFSQKISANNFNLKICSDNRGYVLLTTYILMAALSVTAMASMTRTFTYTRDAERQKNAIIAQEMAEGAIDKAVTALAASTSYTGTGGYVDFSSGSARGGYSITVSTPSGASSSIKQIAVTGYAPGNTSTVIGYKTISSNTYVSLPTSSGNFTHAAFAKQSVSISGNPTINSYISSNGAYSGASARANGDVGSNSTTAGGISLSGSVSVRGDVQYGVGGAASVVTVGGASAITGTTGAQTTNKTFVNPTTAVASSGALSIRHGTTTLAAGTYNYTSLDISANGSLATSGAVTIYVSGSVSLGGGGAAGVSGIPSNLRIYVTGSSAVSVSGNSGITGVIYAPQSTVTLGGTGDIYGAVVGNIVNISGNGNIHYDEDLDVASGSSSTDPTVLTYIQTGNANWTV